MDDAEGLMFSGEAMLNAHGEAVSHVLEGHQKRATLADQTRDRVLWTIVIYRRSIQRSVGSSREWRV